jgi:hypothetical protein
MSITITNLQENVFGDKRIAIFDIALGVYASGGLSLVPADVGLRKFDLVLISPTGGYSYTYNTSTSKVMALRSPAQTSTGVISGPITVAMSGVTLTGPHTTGAILKLNSDTATGALSKTEATSRSIAPATFGIPVPTATISPVFVGGTSTTAVMPEVTGTPTLSATARVMVIGD